MRAKSEALKMGMQSDPTVVHSSIALLQERFRQLQRAKEKREEREFLRSFSQPEHVNQTTCHEPSRLFFISELILPSRPSPPSGSLSMQSSWQTNSRDTLLQETQTIPTLANLWSKEIVMMDRSNTFDDSDVDTSLHL